MAVGRVCDFKLLLVFKLRFGGAERVGREVPATGVAWESSHDDVLHDSVGRCCCNFDELRQYWELKKDVLISTLAEEHCVDEGHAYKGQLDIVAGP